MVAQKINVCPRRGDDIGTQYDPNIQRHGFFANESQDSTSFESDRNRSFNVRQEPTSERSLRSCDRPKNGISIFIASANANANDQLYTESGNELLHVSPDGKPTSPVNACVLHSLKESTKHAEFLKPEPVFQSTMFHDSDAEFFQDLIQWCDAPTEQVVVQSIDPPKTTQTGALNTDTLHTQFSPQGWDVFDANSPITPSGLFNPTPPSYPVSPNADGMATFNTDLFGPVSFAGEDKIPFQEQFLDIDKLPVVISELASETQADANPWQMAAEPVWHTTHDMSYMKPHTDLHNTMPFIDQEDSLDMKLMSVMPREVEKTDLIVSEYVIGDMPEPAGAAYEPRRALALDVRRSTAWPAPPALATPDVLTYVEQLENEKCPLIASAPMSPVVLDASSSSVIIDNSPPVEYEPITPKSEPQVDSEEDSKSNPSKRRRHDSEESDETYTPYPEQSPRKYKRRKPNIPIKDMIRALEGSQQLTKARRGRPPKRRDSTVSDLSEHSCASTHETKYRELRDKNNEASKRSRMNRKLKELQMEQLAEELEERNKKLRVRAELLDDMTKKLRDAFMAAVAQHKVG